VRLMHSHLLIVSGRSHPELFLTHAEHSVQDQWAYKKG